ncbi:MAG: hypothetical protein WA775_03085 [Psychroserpens sp.]|uniref:hypothetical protein n=1 Tax=Psychroserpens sp. TaxID=2020870 RepID=UPI003C820D41
MNQQNIRDFNNQEYSIEEGAALVKELNLRTQYAVDGYNSISELGVKVAALEAAQNNDGNHTPLFRANTIENVAPTAAEIPNPENGDTADTNLNDQLLEKWSLINNNWVKAFKFSIAPTLIVPPAEEAVIGNVLEVGNANGNVAVNFTQVSHADLTFTANGTLVITPPNLGPLKSKTVTMVIKGDFAVTEPANFTNRKNQDRDQVAEAFYAITYWTTTNGTLKLKVTIDNMTL